MSGASKEKEQELAVAAMETTREYAPSLAEVNSIILQDVLHATNMIDGHPKQIGGPTITYAQCLHMVCALWNEHNKNSRSVKSIPPNTENWLRKLYDKNYNNDTSNEDKHETNYSMNNDTRNMHIT